MKKWQITFVIKSCFKRFMHEKLSTVNSPNENTSDDNLARKITQKALNYSNLCLGFQTCIEITVETKFSPLSNANFLIQSNCNQRLINYRSMCNDLELNVRWHNGEALTLFPLHDNLICPPTQQKQSESLLTLNGSFHFLSLLFLSPFSDREIVNLF